MRFGICGGFDIAHLALEAGFDYVEVNTSEFTTCEDFNPADYRAICAEASNVFFPGTIRFFGEHATPYLDYVKKAVDRAAQIGIETMVVGSGTARTAPPGVHLVAAEAQFVDIAAEMTAIAAGYGIRIAPESLGRAETNVWTDLGKFAHALQAKGVAYTADSYHVLYEWQADGGGGIPAPEVWAQNIPFLPAHVHLGTLPRSVPWETDALLKGFVSRILSLGYEGRVSVESSIISKDAATLSHVLAQLRNLFEAA